MAVSGMPARDRSAVLAVAGVSVAVLAVLAAQADARAVGALPSDTALDLAVGLTFVLASFLAIGSPSERLLIGAVGPAWLAGSVFGSARSLHQGILAVALLAFPTGRVPGLLRHALAFGAILVSCEIVPQLGVAALFATIAAVALASLPTPGRGSAYPAAASTSIAAALLFSWWALHRATLASPLVVYEITMLAVAVAFPLATRAAVRSRARLEDQVLGDARVAGLPGLRRVLAGVLDDPDLTIDLWDGRAHAYVDSGAGGLSRTRLQDGFPVFDGDQLLARVITTSPAFADGPTAAAVGAAVRLAVINHWLRDQQAQRIADLEASRARLLAASDRERERVASRLLAGPRASLEEAHCLLSTAGQVPDPELSALIVAAAQEVAAAADEVQRIVGGAPPTALGAGELRAAIEELAARCPMEVSLELAVDAAADATTETVLFYVCSEALANASKHSNATLVTIDLSCLDERLLLRVHDDGRGGADAQGSGLQGLADRAEAGGGTLDVSSPAGGGTTITALIPRQRV
jgi:signal transduction histidine kinase